MGRQSTRGHDTVDVGMMLEALPPGVQDHEAANRHAQAFRVGRDLQERRCGCPKQEVVHDALVGECEPGQANGLDVTDAARDYIHLYRGDSAALSESLGRIQRTSATILMRIGLDADALEGARSAA